MDTQENIFTCPNCSGVLLLDTQCDPNTIWLSCTECSWFGQERNLLQRLDPEGGVECLKWQDR